MRHQDNEVTRIKGKSKSKGTGKVKSKTNGKTRVEGKALQW